MQLEKQVDKLVNQILLRAENQHELSSDDCQSGVAITDTQEHILMFLSQERLTNSDLAKRLNISQAAITKAVKYLMNQGMSVPVRDKEGVQMTYFELIDIVKPVAKEHTRHHDATLTVYKNLLNQFSDDEQNVIARLLKVFSDELEE